jgi:hypothetical protein
MEFGSFLQVDDVVDCLDTDHNWLSAEIIDVSLDAVFIHYMGWQPKYDEWIPRKSNRLLPHRTHTSISHKKNVEHKGSPEKKFKSLDYAFAHPEFSDIIIKCKNDKELKYSRVLLVANSEVFKGILKEDLCAKELTLDVSSEVFEVVMYIIDKKELIIDINPLILGDAYIYAHKYNFILVMTKILEHLSKHIRDYTSDILVNLYLNSDNNAGDKINSICISELYQRPRYEIITCLLSDSSQKLKLLKLITQGKN